MLRTGASSLLTLTSHQTSSALNNLSRLVKQARNQYEVQTRSLATSKPSLSRTDASYIEDNLKLDVEQSPDATYIEAIPVDTGRQKSLIKVDGHSTACVLCRLNLRNLNYTDVMILSQFIKRNGSMVTYHESRLCTKQYLRVVDLIRKAQRCNLIQRPPDYLVPGAWHDLNTYLEPNRKRDQPMKVIRKEYWKL